MQVSQMAFQFATSEEALAALVTLPTPEETAREIAEIEEQIAVSRMARYTTRVYDAYKARASFAIADTGISADAVWSIAGDFLYWIVVTPRETVTVPTILGLETAVKRGGAHMFVPCTIVDGEASPSTVDMPDFDPDDNSDLELDAETAD